MLRELSPWMHFHGCLLLILSQQALKIHYSEKKKKKGMVTKCSNIWDTLPCQYACNISRSTLYLLVPGLPCLRLTSREEFMEIRAALWKHNHLPGRCLSVNKAEACLLFRALVFVYICIDLSATQA